MGRRFDFDQTIGFLKNPCAQVSGSPATSRNATAAPAGKVTIDHFTALHYGRREDHPQRVLKLFHRGTTPPYRNS
jgi:hypothetical protein